MQLTAEVFEELNNSRPELKAIHAGEYTRQRMALAHRSDALQPKAAAPLCPCLTADTAGSAGLDAASLVNDALAWTWSGIVLCECFVHGQACQIAAKTSALDDLPNLRMQLWANHHWSTLA